MSRTTLAFALALVLTGAVAGCGAGKPLERRATLVHTTANDMVIASQTDARRGVIFEIQSSTDGAANNLYVRLIKNAPAATRRALVGKILAFTCTLPHRQVRYFANRWYPGQTYAGTSMFPQGPTPRGVRLVMATHATGCTLGTPPDGAWEGTSLRMERSSGDCTRLRAVKSPLLRTKRFANAGGEPAGSASRRSQTAAAGTRRSPPIG